MAKVNWAKALGKSSTFVSHAVRHAWPYCVIGIWQPTRSCAGVSFWFSLRLLRHDRWEALVQHHDLSTICPAPRRCLGAARHRPPVRPEHVNFPVPCGCGSGRRDCGFQPDAFIAWWCGRRSFYFRGSRRLDTAIQKRLQQDGPANGSQPFSSRHK